MLRPVGEDDDACGFVDEPQPIPDAAPYHAYVTPRGPADVEADGSDDDDDEKQQHQQQQYQLASADDEGEAGETKPLRQLRTYLRRQEALHARPWWRLRSASYLLLVLVGLCYLGGRRLLLRYVRTDQWMRMRMITSKAQLNQTILQQHPPTPKHPQGAPGGAGGRAGAHQAAVLFPDHPARLPAGRAPQGPLRINNN